MSCCRFVFRNCYFLIIQNEEASLVNFDLSEYKQLLRHQSTVFYHQIIDLVHSELKPLIGENMIRVA